MKKRRRVQKVDSLTRKQKLLIKELDEICYLLDMDYQKIREYAKETRTTYLELTKDKLVRSAIILAYTLIDEHLNNEMCGYFFGKKKSFIYLWRTKKFQIFNYYVLEELYLLQKLRFVRAFVKIPNRYVNNIHKINTLRNAVSHAFFPQNLRKSKPVYKGRNIFSVEGMRLLVEDMDEINTFFLKRL